MQEEIDDQFAGVISGYETQILLNSQRLEIKIESHSKETEYKALIEYQVENTLLKEVKKSFKNLTLLLEYINEFSEDPERIKIDLNKCELKIIKNEGLRRLKTAPILIIPLTKRFLFEKKQKTFLETQIEKSKRHSEILDFRFTYLKRQQKKLINEHKDIENWMKQYCKENLIEWSVINQNQNDIEIQKEGNQKKQVQKRYTAQLDKILKRSNSVSEYDDDETLFFESQQLTHEKRYRKDKATDGYFSRDSKSFNVAQDAENSYQSYDPFSYL